MPSGARVLLKLYFCNQVELSLGLPTGAGEHYSGYKPTMSNDFAYLAQGKLHLKIGDAAVRTVESQFGNSVRQRAQDMHQRHSWKTQGRGAQFMRGGVLWGGATEADPALMPIRISGLSGGCQAGELLYSLDTPEIAGLFVVKDGGQYEQRLFHTADYRVGHVTAHPEGKKIACSFTHKGGTSSIAIMNNDGSEMAEATQGDTIDMAPTWVPGAQHELVFQSAGLARNRAGQMVGRGAFAVHRLNLNSGDLTTIAENAIADLLGPRMAQDGTLYYIKRPYRGPGARVGVGQSALDFILFPFRLLYALFQYLNFFTMSYTGKSLTSAGSAAREADVRQMMAWGNLIDAQKTGRARGEDGTPSLVPKNWELVRQRPDGSLETIARGVLSFDLYEDGGVLYSNGSAVYRLRPEGQTERLAKDSLIEQVVAL